MRRVLDFLRRPTIFLAVGLIVSAFSGSVYLLIVNLAFDSHQVLSACRARTAARGDQHRRDVRHRAGDGPAVSRAIAHHLPTAPVIRRQVRQAGWFVASRSSAAWPSPRCSRNHFLGGSWIVFAELMVGLVGAVVSFQVRGTLSGKQDFHVFSITLLVESFTRLLPCLVLVAIGNRDVWLYGLMFALGPVLSAVVGIVLPKVWYRPQYAELASQAGEKAATAAEETGGRAVANLGLLTGATLASQVLQNVVPLLVVARYQHARGTEADRPPRSTRRWAWPGSASWRCCRSRPRCCPS